tara:strand:+ start:293 stop:499 length:207 start_codon:yes stop_codon:yes gene_type:complete
MLLTLGQTERVVVALAATALATELLVQTVLRNQNLHLAQWPTRFLLEVVGEPLRRVEHQHSQDLELPQ